MGEETATFVPIPLFLSTLSGQKLLDTVGMGWCGLQCGKWLFLKLELCVTGPLFCGQLKKKKAALLPCVIF